MITSLDSHISSLTEDPTMTVGTLLSIAEDLLRGSIPIKEKIDGQNFTIGFNGDEFVLLMKGNEDFEKGKTEKALRDEIFKLSSIPDKRAGLLIQVKKKFLKNLSSINKKYKQSKETSFETGTILECAMLDDLTKNLLSYRTQGIVLLDSISSADISDQHVSNVGIVLLKDSISYDIDDESIFSSLENLKGLFRDCGLTNTSMIGEYIQKEVKSILDDELIISPYVIEDFANRIAFKDKKLANYRKIKSKATWEEFKLLEKYSLVYRKASKAIDLELSSILNKIYKESRDQFLEPACDYTGLFSKYYYDMSNLVYDGKHSKRFNYEIEISKEIAQNSSCCAEGIVFISNDIRYKITGAFTSINKLNGFLKYN